MGVTNSVPQGLFGPGILYLTRTDVALATPVNIGFISEFSYDITGETKQLYGQNDLPLLVASGTKKCTGKMKPATISGLALNSVLWGGTFDTTQRGITSSPATAIPATPFDITPTVPNTGTFESDLGVINAATREPLTKVTGTPAAGEYAVNTATGQYTFSSADNVSGISVIISFSYSFTGGGGQKMVYSAKPIGQSPTFQIDYSTILYGAEYCVRFFNAISSKLTMQHKTTDFAMPEIDFEFFTDATGRLMDVSLATKA